MSNQYLDTKTLIKVKKDGAHFFLNNLSEYLNQNKSREKKKQKYEQKELKQLLKNNETLNFRTFWLKFLDSPFLQNSFSQNLKIKTEDAKQEYLKLIPEIKGETQSESLFTNFLAATYTYEVNQKIISPISVERNNHNEQEQTNLSSQLLYHSLFDDTFI